MSRGPRAEASRAIARRSICALAALADEVLTCTGHHTDATRAWLASWKTDRVPAHPQHDNLPVHDLLCTLHDALLDVWRHVTHERVQRARVLRRAALVLQMHGMPTADAQSICARRHQRICAEMQAAEMSPGERGSRG